jgi:SAM-dependent methyltransferase
VSDVHSSLDLTELAVPRSFQLLEPLLPPTPARLLEVGCGRGALAAELGHRGWRVTGVDPDDEACVAARARGVDVLNSTLSAVDRDGFDAVLFTLSMHHLEDLPGAIADAVARLRPGGRLVVQEFARERVDAAAAAFLYDSLDLLLAAGRADPADAPHEGHGHDHGEVPTDPMARWAAQRAHLHTGEDMLATLAAYGTPTPRQDCEVLWRLAVSKVTDAAVGPAIGTTLRETETRRIADGSLPAIGFVTAVQLT